MNPKTPDLDADSGDIDPQEIYHLLTALVIPRPIGWISTVSDQGVPNLAPYSYFNLVSSNPPHLMFSSSGVKDSLTNIRATGDFVANIATMELVEAMNLSATDFPENVDEFSRTGLTPAPSSKVDALRVAEAKAHLECKLVQEIPAGNGFIVLGEIVHIHVSGSVFSDGRIDPELLNPVCRLSGSLYASLGEIFKLPRPTFAELEAEKNKP